MEKTKQLVQACIKGERNAQKELYDQYAVKMFGVCMRYSKNREEAEDIMQEGFMNVFKSLHQFNYAGSFEGWVRRIMMNCSIQYYRKKVKVHPLIGIEKHQEEHASNEEIVSRIQKKELLEMVQNLPPAYRMVFNLYVFEGYKHREIAELLSISEGTSKSNLFDAKLLLQKAVTNSLRIAKNY